MTTGIPVGNISHSGEKKHDLWEMLLIKLLSLNIVAVWAK